MADYYQSDGGDSGESSPEHSDDNLQETALIPKSMLGDKEIEVGKKCEFKIVSVYDDEVEIEYVPHKKDKKDKDSDDDDDKPKRHHHHHDHDRHWRDGNYLDDDANRSIDAGIVKMGMI